MSDLAAYGGALLVLGAAAVTWAARLAGAVQRPPAAPFVPAVPGTRWLRCDTTRCAHLTRQHVPVGDGGGWRCTECDDVKGQR